MTRNPGPGTVPVAVGGTVDYYLLKFCTEWARESMMAIQVGRSDSAGRAAGDLHDPGALTSRRGRQG
jgi:hypothetical protein